MRGGGEFLLNRSVLLDIDISAAADQSVPEIPLPTLPAPGEQVKTRIKEEVLSDEPVVVSERVIRNGS